MDFTVRLGIISELSSYNTAFWWPTKAIVKDGARRKACL